MKLRTVHTTPAQTFDLSQTDQRTLLDALISPPAPNEALRQAKVAHRRLVKSTRRRAATLLEK